MWSRSAVRLSRVASNGTRSHSFASSSLQKRALKALGNKNANKPSLQPESPKPNKDDETTKVDHPSLDNVIPKDQTESAKENVPPTTASEFPKPILAAPTPPPSGQLHEFAPRIVVCGVGGGGGNAINNMISKELQGKCIVVGVVDVNE